MRQSERHRLTVEQIDRRRQWRIRVGITSASALLGVLLLWNADFRPRSLEAWISRWHHSEIAKSAPVIPRPRTVAAARHTAPIGRMGTDASASKIPHRLLLVHTTPGRNVHTGVALIGVDRTHPQTYLAGAILESGARIDEIYSDHVVLVKGSERKVLYVDDGTVRSQPNDPLLTVGGPLPRVESPHFSSDPITDFIRPVPVYENGIITGFQVYPGRRAGVFARWGLKSGDVVIALDGQPLTDADQTLGILHTLAEGASMTASVRRGDASVEVSLDGTDIQNLETARNVAPTPPPAPR